MKKKNEVRGFVCINYENLEKVRKLGFCVKKIALQMLKCKVGENVDYS